MYPKKLELLIEQFKILPGVGSKTAERYALLMLSKSKEELQQFAEAIEEISELKHCQICGNIAEDDECIICQNQTRDKQQICVVESSKDIIAMEKTTVFNGVYHVLGGLIAPNKGIFPEDINLASLLERIAKDEVKEVILATNLTMNGETTALYIDKLLQDKDVLVTRIAQGIPMGGHVDYADELTLSKALQGRKKI